MNDHSSPRRLGRCKRVGKAFHIELRPGFTYEGKDTIVWEGKPHWEVLKARIKYTEPAGEVTETLSPGGREL